MRATTRQRPAGPPAASVRPGSGGIGRSTSAAAERVSDDLRRGTGDFLEQRRWIAGLSTLAAGALGMVGLYQFGVLRRVPEPPLPFLNADADAVDADAVDASGEAYQAFKTPDAALGLVSAGATLVLAGMGARDRARATPWIPLALAAKTAADAAGGGYLLAEQVTKHRAVAAPLLRHLPQTALYPAIVQLIHRGHDDRARALESIGVHWQPYVTHGAAAALMRQVSALHTRDTLAVAGQLPSLGLPARVVWGEADRFQKVSYGRRLAADLGTTLLPIPRGRHFTPEDHPEILATAINDLLDARETR